MTDPIDTDAVRAMFTGGDPREFDFCEFRSAAVALCDELDAVRAELDAVRAREAKTQEIFAALWSEDDDEVKAAMRAIWTRRSRALDETP